MWLIYAREFCGMQIIFLICIFTSSIHALIAKRTKVNNQNSLQKHGRFSRKESGIHETRFKVLRNESLIHVMPGKKGGEGILKDYCMRWDAAEPPVESKHLEISASLSRVWRHEWSQELFVVYAITSPPIRGQYQPILTNEEPELATSINAVSRSAGGRRTRREI